MLACVGWQGGLTLRVDSSCELTTEEVQIKEPFGSENRGWAVGKAKVGR
jgi:hypothetical protein